MGRLLKYSWQYLMILLAVVLLFLFNCDPMAGIQVAFRGFRIGQSIWSSLWVGLEIFSFLHDEQFWIIVGYSLRRFSSFSPYFLHVWSRVDASPRGRLFCSKFCVFPVTLRFYHAA